MKNYLVIALLVVFAAACSEESANEPLSKPPTTAHDTIAIHNPPQPGGSLSGSWKAQPDVTYWLTSQGVRGFMGVLYYTDLRVDGDRVWFEAWEIGTASEKILFNGTKVDSTINGWFGRKLRMAGDYWDTHTEYAPMTFTRE